MIEHPQRLEYQQYWVIPKLRKGFNRVCKNSIFVLDSGDPVEYDVDYYRRLIDGGHINDNNLWVFWMKHEAYLPFESDIRNLHKVCKELDLDESKIVFVNSDLNLHNNYTEWFGGTNFEKPINCIGFSWHFLHDRENLIDGFGHNPYEFVRYTDREKLPSKKFICLNGNSTKPRRYVINKLEEYKNFGYISDLSKGISIDVSLTKKELLENLAGGNARFLDPNTNVLDSFHNDSYFSIVQESGSGSDEVGGGWKANSSDKISAFFSEKITKPLYYGHPFILIGFKNSLKVLRDMGFKTYDDIFDESYDELETWEERTKHVWYQVERLLKLSKEELKKMFEKVEDKILFNQERFFSYDGHVDNFITELEELYMERDK
jgi:hypothetical protein